MRCSFRYPLHVWNDFLDLGVPESLWQSYRTPVIARKEDQRLSIGMTSSSANSVYHCRVFVTDESIVVRYGNISRRDSAVTLDSVER